MIGRASVPSGASTGEKEALELRDQQAAWCGKGVNQAIANIKNHISPVLKGKATEHIELIDNTPEEIKTISVEMDERLKGTWVTNEEDEEMQLRFKSLFKPNNINSIIKCRVGRDFLRENF